MKKITLLILTAILVSPLLSSIPESFQLSDSELTSVSNGELVLKKKKIKGAPWPEITIFSKINASPGESMGVFYAYHEHQDFLPDLLSSTPSRYISPTDLHIKFEMKIPWPLRNSRYTTGNRLKTYGKGGYRIDWYHVISTSSKTTRGFVIFLPLDKGTLFIYRTFVHPKSKLAGMFRKRMISEVRKSVKAIIARIEWVRNSHRDMLPEYINPLERSLKGEYIYKDIPGGTVGQKTDPD